MYSTFYNCIDFQNLIDFYSRIVSPESIQSGHSFLRIIPTLIVSNTETAQNPCVTLSQG